MSFVKITEIELKNNPDLLAYFSYDRAWAQLSRKRDGVFVSSEGVAGNGCKKFGIVLQKGGMIIPKDSPERISELIEKALKIAQENKRKKEYAKRKKFFQKTLDLAGELELSVHIKKFEVEEVFVFTEWFVMADDVKLFRLAKRREEYNEVIFKAWCWVEEYLLLECEMIGKRAKIISVMKNLFATLYNPENFFWPYNMAKPELRALGGDSWWHNSSITLEEACYVDYAGVKYELWKDADLKKLCEVLYSLRKKFDGMRKNILKKGQKNVFQIKTVYDRSCLYRGASGKIKGGDRMERLEYYINDISVYKEDFYRLKRKCKITDKMVKKS